MPPATHAPPSVRLTALSHGAGCACKLGPGDLSHIIQRLPLASSPDLLVGPDLLDDGAVWRRPDGSALVATVDFFTPIVDDPHTWGRIAGTNAASDVYAMGGRPLFALNLAGWPREQVPLDLFAEVLAGGAAAAAEGGWVVVGGHTVDSLEPLYGQAVIGEVPEDGIFRNDGGRPGDALVLTKPIGTGLVATAVKRNPPEAVAEGGDLVVAYEAAVTAMTRLNAAAAVAARAAGATAVTDVTGFGLLGHLHQLARASGVGAEVHASAVPLLPQARELLDAGYVSGGTRRNVEYVRPWLAPGVDGPDEDTVTLLADAQTSGGLLFACPAEATATALASLEATDHQAAVIGILTDGGPGALRLV